MKITTTITVRVERDGGGSETTVSETFTRDAGGNPRFEGYEVGESLRPATALLLAHWPNRPVPANAVIR